MSIDWEALGPNPNFKENFGLNKTTVVPDETMDGIDTHINDMNGQGYLLVSAIGRGNYIMLFWKKA